MRYIISTVLALFLCTQAVFAQTASTTFTIKVFGGTDTEPPSTPTMLTADPVTPYQIDVTWSSSTDNAFVSGYSLWRDGSPLATTTLLSYSDTGLTPSTTYSYFVYAFDTSFNYSSSSNILATTTPDLPPPPPAPTSTDPSESTVARVAIKDFTVEVGVSTTSLNLETSFPSRIEVRWGRTSSYELGYVVNEVYRRINKTLLTDLEPGTTYEYEVVAYTPSGRVSVVESGSFTTLSEAVVASPDNVNRFMAWGEGPNAVLSWEMPEGENISHVRIVRSHLGFPAHPLDGAVIYQGSNESALDVGVLNFFSPVYYTAFVYDIYGNVSSGAVTLVYASTWPGVGAVEEDGGWSRASEPVITPPILTEEATSSIDKERIKPKMKMPQANEIVITQGEEIFTMIESDIVLKGEEPYTIAIDKGAVAGNLKSIIVTVIDPTNHNNAYAYLLRINKDQSAYEATVPAMRVAGRSQLKLEIFDYEAYVVATYQAPINFVTAEELPADIVPDSVYIEPLLLYLIIGLLLILLIVIFFIYKRNTEDKE